jgi:hypothetical protein
MMPAAEPQASAIGRSLCVLFVVAVLLRFGVFLTASHLYQMPLSRFAVKGDGGSYLAYASAILGDSSQLTEYDRRVFPGYPLLIAAGHLGGLSLPLSALLIDWISAGVAVATAGALFAERRVAWAMVFLVPHYLTNSSLAMSEAPLLAFTLAGLLLIVRGRHALLGGILLGFAGLIRPMACFAVIGVMLTLLAQRRVRDLLISGACAAAVFAVGVIALHLLSGDALRGLRIYHDSPRTYGGEIFVMPFQSLLTTPAREHVSIGFVVYIYAHVLIVLSACALLAWRALRRSSTIVLDLLALGWLVGNTLFQLCIGSGWGFRHFPRFAIPAQPALFWALHPYLPRRAWPWIVAATGIFCMAVQCVNLAP